MERMAEANLANGMPPQMVQFNGVHSSHSSRDSSPSARVGQIPSSQLPPTRGGIPASQLPPSRSPMTQKMAQLRVNNSSFNTSTPNQTLQNPSGLVTSAFSPIKVDNSVSNQVLANRQLSGQQPPRTLPPSSQVQSNPIVPSQPSPIPPSSQPQETKINGPPMMHSRSQPPAPQIQQGRSVLVPQNQQIRPAVSQQMVPPKSQQSGPHIQPIRPQVAPQNPQLWPPTSQPPLQQMVPPSPQIQQMVPPTNQLPGPQIQQVGSQSQQIRPPTSKTSVQQMMPPTRNPPGPYTNGPQVMNLNGPQQNSGAYLPQIQQQQGQYGPPGAAVSGAPPSQFKTTLHTNRYPQQQAPPIATNNFYQQPTQPSPNAFYQQQQQHQFQQASVTQSGFNRLWGQDNIDLLQNPNVLPREKVQAPKVFLGNEMLDSANCSPDVFRCTMTKIPESSALLQKSRLPLGILIHPFKDLTHLPVIQCNAIVRCRACRTYINPFVFFVDAKRWKCNLCYRINELPDEFQYDPVSKTYGDPSRRPEIKSSTIEYVAPAEYMLRPPQPAVYLFLFDISRLALESGYLHSVCSVLLEELKNLPGDARTQVGIIAYDSALHFFGLGEGLNQPHEMTVLDIDDVFLPCPDNLLVNLKDRMDLLTDLLNQLPTRFNTTYDNNSALGAALQAAQKMMAATGGRVTVFQASLPNVGPGALQPREDPNQRASSEVSHLNPANDFYKRLALECSGQQIAVDLFIVNSQYVDIATISGISRFSGGCIHHFPLFKASRVLQNDKFERCFRRYLVRKIGFEAVMRIRCTRGLSIHTFHGNFFVRSTDLLSLPNVNPDAGFGMQVSIDESLSDIQSVCFQAALLYTSSKGERRIRVHTLCIPICSTLTDVINAADQQCIVGLLAKMAVDRSMQSSLSDAREAFINVAIDILSSYKLSLNMGNGQSALLAPHCLKLLPLYISALLKYIAFRIGTSTRLDDRVKAMIDMKTRPLSQLIQMIYPDLYPVHNLEEQPVILNSEDEPVPQPPHLQLSARCLDSKGAFLLDCGEHMILLVSPGVSPQFLNEILGVRDYISISDEMYDLPILDNLHNQRLHQFINYLNDEKPFVATLHIIRDNSPNRVDFFERLIEDRVENALSYHEFMQHLKTQVK